MANSQACFPMTVNNQGEPVLNTITKVRMADGREVGIVDWTWKPSYSTIDTLSGWTDQERRAFTYSEGDPITVTSNLGVREVATLRHTNAANPGEMDATEEMLVYAMGVEVYQMTLVNDTIVGTGIREPLPFAHNVAILNQACIMELEVSQKDYFQAPLGWFPPGFGVAAAGAPTVLYGQEGVPSLEAVDMAPVPVHIGGTEKFSAILYNPDATAVTYRTEAGAADTDAVLRLRIHLRGLYKRSAA